MPERHDRMARMMLRDGQIWFLYSGLRNEYRAGDHITVKAWGYLANGPVYASQSRLQWSSDGPKVELMRFNRDHVLWVVGDQG